MELTYEESILIHSVSRDVHTLLRSRNFDSIRPILMRLDRMERHTAISMVYHLLANDITTPDLDVIFIQRIKEEQLAMSKIVGEIVSFDREMLRIDKLSGYNHYKNTCKLQGIKPWSITRWHDENGISDSDDSR